MIIFQWNEILIEKSGMIYKMAALNNKKIVSAYYDMWNNQNFEQAKQFFDPHLRFRSSLGIETLGIANFIEYTQMSYEAFPNLHHAAEIMIAENDQVAVYVSYTGTHKGRLFDFEATNRRISYSGATFFKLNEGKITDIKVLGDRYTLYQQLEAQ